MSRSDLLQSLAMLLIAAPLLMPFGAAIYTLVGRRGPPLAGYVVATSLASPLALGVAFALAWPEREAGLLSEYLLLWPAFCAMLWLLGGALMAVATWLQPGDAAEMSPIRSLALIALLAATSPLIYLAQRPELGIFAALLPSALPLLASRRSEQIERALADLALLQISALGVLAVLVLVHGIPRYLLGDILRLSPLLQLLPAALVAASILVMTPFPRRALALVSLPCALSLLSVLVGVAHALHTWITFQLRAPVDLPVAEAESYLPIAGYCVESPEHPCPGDEPILFAWPADLPIRRESLAHQGETAIVYERDGRPATLFLLSFSDVSGISIPLTREGERYNLAGRTFSASEMKRVMSEANAACVAVIGIDPKVSWTPQEIVSACDDRICALGEGQSEPRCSYSAERGWTQLCKPGEICEVSPAHVRCEGSGCTIQMTTGGEPPPLAISCPEGGCKFSGTFSVLDFECAAGGCSAIGPGTVTFSCEGGGCTHRSR